MGRTLTNVLGVKTGTVDPSRIYIICGHLDSTSPEPATLAPGAEDNGSGSVSVLEAARLLAPVATDYTVYFLCLSAEEQGLIGSEHFAAEAAQQSLDIRGVLNLDMVGFRKAGGADLWLEGFQSGASSVWLADMVEANAEAYTNLVIYRYPGDGWGSDHASFHDYGFPAILSIEAEWDTYSCYHRTCDTPSLLSGPLWRKITASNVITLGQLAGAQGSTGQLGGTVSLAGNPDPSGATLTLAGTGYAGQVCAGDGAYGWPDLFPGDYVLITEKDGYVPDTTAVAIASGGASVADIVLLPVGASGVAGEPGGSETAVAARLSISPNPMFAGAVIRLRLPDARGGDLWVYGPDGRRVTRLHAQRDGDGGLRFAWDGRDVAGRLVPAGLYWVRWQDGGRQAQRSLVVIR
jgi:hypothetical protein